MRRTLTALAVGALALAGCTTSQEEPEGADPSPRPTAAPSPPSTPSPPSPTSPTSPADGTGTSPPDDGPSMVPGPDTTASSSEEPDGGLMTITDLRVEGHETFDRLVLEIAGEGEVGWQIEYVEEPRSAGSGHEVDIAGDAVLRISVTGIAYPADAPAEPRDGPQRLEPAGTNAIVEVLDDTLYEGHHEFFVGLDERRPYRVARLAGPQRVVVDIAAS